MQDTIEFTQALIKKFEAAYNEARLSGAETFDFGDNIIFTDYARYLLQFLTQRMGGQAHV